MSKYLEWPDYLLVTVLFVVYTCVGIYYWFRPSFSKCLHRMRNRAVETFHKDSSIDAEEVFLGNRKMGLFPIFCSTLASFLSAVALMGNNSEFYRFGIEFWCIVFGYCIAFPLSAEIYAPVFYKLNLVSGHEVH